eukprot:gene9463-1705_t
MSRLSWRDVIIVFLLVVILYLVKLQHGCNKSKIAEAPPWKPLDISVDSSALKEFEQTIVKLEEQQKLLKGLIEKQEIEHRQLKDQLKKGIDAHIPPVEPSSNTLRDKVSSKDKFSQKQPNLQKLENNQQQKRQQSDIVANLRDKDNGASNAYIVRNNPAEVCVSLNSNSQKCEFHRCGARDEPMAPYGLIYRPPELRTSTMRISGQRGAGSGCLLVHKYQFIVTHVLKSGGSEIKGAFMAWLCNGKRDPVCPGVYEIADCSRAVSSHPDYFIVSFVRNPYSRAISSWAMAVDFMQNKQNHPVDFSEWALNPSAGSRKMGSLLASVHWSPQAMFNTDRRGCPVFDFIGHLETLNEDLIRLAKILNVPELIDAAVNHPLQKPKENNAGNRAAEQKGSRVDFYTPESARAIARLFSQDFEIFGFKKYSYMGKEMG